MVNINEVIETNKMVEEQTLDVRTITIGISLLECIDSDLKKVNENVYKRITTVAKDLDKVAMEIERDYGIPIVNRRISVTPIALVGGAACKSPEDFVTLAHTLDKAAEAVGANLIGGYSALVSKGMTTADEMLIRSIPQALCETQRVCSSVNLASTKTGINMDAVRLMGDILLQVADRSKDRDSVDCMKLVVFCNAPDDNPFMAGAFHGVTEADAIINVGVSGPGVVKKALEQVRGKSFEVLCETIKKTAFKVTRVGQLVAQEASKRLGIPFGIIDLSLAPTPAEVELEQMTGLTLSEVCIAAAGRVLRTVTTHVELEYPEETVVTGEDLHTLDMMGIEQAGKEIKGDEDNKYKFFCVGYSTVKYYLNGDPFTSLEDHKADVIGEDIIVTFLPEDVVDGLYAAVGKAGLSVANLTLEPIAAINVAIPQNFRMLNIALIDVGAGTSDICVTRDGSIIAYGMIPMAGDELTEVLVHEFLVDFATAEHIKRASTEGGDITYEDIMGISHTISSEDVWKLTTPVMQKIAGEVAAKIKELNGGKTVSAAFVVGGGGKIHGFTEVLAKDLKIVPERVALRGEEVMKNIIFEQEDVQKDSLLVTPIGICLNYYETKNNFIMIHFNGEMMKLYDNGQLTIVDAAMQAGFSAEQLFPRRGREINFTVNGVSRMIRGTEGESAVVTMNGKPVGINAPLEFNCEIELTPSTVGAGGNGTIADLAEFTTEYLYFTVCGHRVKCPKFVEVNGSMEPPSYSVKEGDVIETRPFYTVGQLAEFMDVTIDDRYEILVNNRPSNKDSLVYENFVIDWTTTSPASYSGDYIAEDGEGLPEDYEPEQPDMSVITDIRTKMKVETVDMPIKINGRDMVLSGKKEYIFVDIYNLINFDPSEGGGRSLVTKINGMKCGYADALHPNDEVECYWMENEATYS